MYAMLGDVRFETLQSFASLEAQHSAKFAKHEVLKGRPRLQAMENDLTTLRFGLKLHWMLGNPDTAYKGLLTALEAQQAVSLVYGSGRFVGWFVIESMTERTLIQDSKGRTAARELDVELTEFVGDPNNPLPTPAIISGKQNPLLSLLPESVQAQAADVMQAVETGVKVYRAAENGIEQMQGIITAVRANGLSLYQTKWAKETQIDALADIEACKIYEATPYEYTITQADVMIGGEVGDVVTRTKNNVMEW